MHDEQSDECRPASADSPTADHGAVAYDAAPELLE
jgi:hypothetical protein